MLTFQFEVEAEEFFSKLKIDESELDKIMIAGKSQDIYLQLTLLGPMESSIMIHTIKSGWSIVYIERSWVIFFQKMYLSGKSILSKQTVQTLMKCRILHPFRGSGLHRVEEIFFNKHSNFLIHQSKDILWVITKPYLNETILFI